MTATLRRALGKESATVADAWQALDKHGLTRGERGARVVAGFTFISGTGECPPPGTLCSQVCLQDGVLVVAEVGAHGRTMLPYAELLAMELGGRGLLRTGARYIGGGSIGMGAVTGMALASLMNNLSQKTVVDSVVRITTERTEMFFSHSRYPPETVRSKLAPVFMRQMSQSRSTPPTVVVQQAPAAAAVEPAPPPATPVDELERLTRLHAAGTLTVNEFEAARAREIGRLKTREG